MKQFLYFVLILGLIYFCYWYLTRTPEIINVTGSIRVLKEETEGDSYKASIHGTATNNGDILVKEVWIVYKIGNDEVTTYINELPPRQSVEFRTGTTRTNIKNPEVELVSVRYDK